MHSSSRYSWKSKDVLLRVKIAYFGKIYEMDKILFVDLIYGVIKTVLSPSKQKIDVRIIFLLKINRFKFIHTFSLFTSGIIRFSPGGSLNMNLSSKSFTLLYTIIKDIQMFIRLHSKYWFFYIFQKLLIYN